MLPARSYGPALDLSCVTIEVEDAGPGVPREAPERIFSPFEQIDFSSKRKHGGLGPGLYIARPLAVAMGGEIELETRPGLGACFTVRIDAPLAAPARHLQETKETEQAGAEERLDILCVDDNARNLYVLWAMLRAAGPDRGLSARRHCGRRDQADQPARDAGGCGRRRAKPPRPALSACARRGPRYCSRRGVNSRMRTDAASRDQAWTSRKSLSARTLPPT